jgi:hypothetical protein
MQKVRDMNRLDLELFDYARRLAMERQAIASVYGAFKMAKFYTVDTSASAEAANDFFRALAVKDLEGGYCEEAMSIHAAAGASVSSSPRYLNRTVGLFQLPGHKGPNPEDASRMMGI